MNAQAYLDSPLFDAQFAGHMHAIREAKKAADIVKAWAAATGHTGPRHSASRHGRRRKIRCHGSDSAYALKMIAETKAVQS